ncbi:FeoA family protein [Candidatus Chloroploca sp. Khr17]|uniref:FeoA family protein n=1 Tax=Candidatus Chloroploca sp. Khr17 TaxID=2496869 RepID=UPI00196A5727|nr:FeoA family protein [Candidatus Chloroploca sp. Khr17]
MNTSPPIGATTLDQLSLGATGRVLALGNQGAERRRLFDLGITPGTLIQSEVRSPLGDPVAYRVRNTLIALRREQSQMIMITLDLEETIV